MTRARQSIIDLESTPLLTITVLPAAHPKRFTGQALRRAFLCGEDHLILTHIN